MPMIWPVHWVVPPSHPATDPSSLRAVRSDSKIPGISPTISEPPVSTPPPIMTCELPESFGPTTCHFSSHDLHKHFGNRKFRNYSIFSQVVDGIHLSENFEPPISIGDVVNQKRGPSGAPLPRPSAILHRVGVDIGFGDGVSPGGIRYCLMLVDQFSRKTWCYGLKDLTSPSISDAF